MDEDDADSNAIDGDMSPSDYDLLTGGSYSNQQSPFDAIDNGTINNDDSGSGTGQASTNGTVKPPSGGASYTPPSWLSGLASLGSTVGNAYTSVAPIIGGKPAAGPAQAGQVAKPAASSNASSTIAGVSTTTWLIIAGVAAAAYFIFRKK